MMLLVCSIHFLLGRLNDGSHPIHLLTVGTMATVTIYQFIATFFSAVPVVDQARVITLVISAALAIGGLSKWLLEGVPAHDACFPPWHTHPCTEGHGHTLYETLLMAMCFYAFSGTKHVSSEEKTVIGG